MKRFVYLIVLLCSIKSPIKAQSYGFYVDGYLLYKKDTTLCKIWFNPDTPYYKSDISIWLNDEAKIISLEKKNNLTGFGITQKGYEMDFGKIRLQGLKSWVYVYTKKLVSGTVELYEFQYTLLEKDKETFALNSENLSAYFIDRTDNDNSAFPTLLKSMKKKKIAAFLKDFPELEKVLKEELTPEELLSLVRQYNTWYQEKNK